MRPLNVTRGTLARYGGQVRDWLPRGRSLPEETWARRHRAVLILLWLHVAAVFLFAPLTGHDALHGATEASVVAAAALAASWRRWSRTMRAAAASFGLVTASAMFVHLSGGYIEAHFHFFVMIGVITLYQDWLPFRPRPSRNHSGGAYPKRLMNSIACS